MVRSGGQDFGTDRVAKPKPEPKDVTQASPALAAFVHVVDGADGQVFALLADFFVIGRGADCHIRIEGDAAVSRKHATVTRRGVSFMLEDLQSANGVFVNGVQIDKPHELRVGDKIEIGDQLYIFKRRA
jgi:pSer/pThr/pTyr-binding forkhead associated (FHA) protein